MTHLRSDNDLEGQGSTQGVREWIRPSVRRLSAGSAEDGALKTGDSGIKPS
jgi:hypothetical protein